MPITRVVNLNKAGKNIVVLICCSSILEEKTAILYKRIAEKVQLPLVKSFLFHIAHDSEKHSAIFRGIGESIGALSKEPKDCRKKLGQIWQVTENLTREIVSKPKISEKEMTWLTERLVPIESFMGEEYYILVQAKTFEFLTKEIRQVYGVNLQSLKHILQKVIKDEEEHMRLLATIKEMLVKRELKRQHNDPEVRYQSPDAWIRSIPSTY
jgi:rubrerythrin